MGGVNPKGDDAVSSSDDFRFRAGVAKWTRDAAHAVRGRRSLGGITEIWSEYDGEKWPFDGERTRDNVKSAVIAKGFLEFGRAEASNNFELAKPAD
jgi:hypothetical protein